MKIISLFLTLKILSIKIISIILKILYVKTHYNQTLFYFTEYFKIRTYILSIYNFRKIFIDNRDGNFTISIINIDKTKSFYIIDGKIIIFKQYLISIYTLFYNTFFFIKLKCSWMHRY